MKRGQSKDSFNCYEYKYYRVIKSGNFLKGSATKGK